MKMSVGTKLSRFCNILSKCRSSIPPHRHFIVPSATKFKTFEPDYLDVRAANRNQFFFQFFLKYIFIADYSTFTKSLSTNKHPNERTQF